MRFYVSGNNGNNSNDEIASFVNFSSVAAADLEEILNPGIRSRNNPSAVFLGYDKSVSQQMCAFIDRLIIYYTALPSYQSFRARLNLRWDQLKETLLKTIDAKNIILNTRSILEKFRKLLIF